MDDVALMLITDEQFDFGLVFSPTSSEQDSSHGDVEGSEKKPKPKPRQLTTLKSASEERSHVTCAADSPISEASFMQIFSDANSIASDIENCRPPVVSCWNRLGLDDCASDVLDGRVSSGNTSVADNDSFQLLPCLRQAVTEGSEHEQKVGSVEEMTVICDQSGSRGTEVADLRSRLERVKSQSRSAAAESNAGKVDTRQVVDSDQCNLVADCKSLNAEERPKKDVVRPLKPNSDAVVNAARRRSHVEPVKSRRRSSAIQKSQNAPEGNRGPASAVKPVGRASSLRRIPSFQRGVPSKRRESKQDFTDVASARSSATAPRVDGVGDPSNADCAPLSDTPPHCKPPPVQQGTITKDRTRRLEKVAGPDMPVSVGKVQNARTSVAPRNVPVRHRYSSDGLGGTSKCAAPVATQKPVLTKKRASIGPSAVTTRSGVNTGRQVRKSLSAATLPPWGATAPPKAAPLKAAPPRPAPPKVPPMPHEPTRSGAPAKQLLLQKPAIKKPMTKLELIKPASLLSRPASAAGKTGLSRAVPLKGRPPGKGAGPLKATLPMAAAVTQRGEGKNDTRCPVGVAETTVTRPSTNGLGPATLLSTPVSQDKCIQRPKRLLLATPPQGNRNNCASSGTPVLLRRSASCLPTPTKRGSYMSGSSTRSSRHPSSSSSVSSSMTSDVCSEASVTRVLVDLNGLDLNSPSCLKSRRGRVQHTPVNKENIDEPAATSLWSPVPRPRVLSREDEVIQCTKHNAPKT